MNKQVVFVIVLLLILAGVIVYNNQKEQFGWGRRGLGWGRRGPGWGRRGPGWRRWGGPRWWGRPDCYCGPYGCNCGYSVGRRGWFW